MARFLNKSYTNLKQCEIMVLIKVSEYVEKELENIMKDPGITSFDSAIRVLLARVAVLEVDKP